MSQRDITTLPLPPILRSQLLAAGFSTVSEFRNLGPIELSKESGITPEEAYEVLNIVQSEKRPDAAPFILDGRRAVELYRAQQDAPRIITFCSEFDSILGGGVSLGQVYEFCGVPGVGKTQLGIQLAVDAQIPAAFGGVEGQAMYIDTEGSFMAERVREVAAAAAAHVQLMAARLGKESEARGFTADAIMDNIFYFRLHDYVEQIALVKLLPDFLSVNPKVKLVVFDSVTFHFRQQFRDMAQRARVLMQMAQELMRIAEERGVAVVFVNQITTKVTGEDSAKLVPSLGESWAHAASWRVVLHWQGSQRCATLYKSPCLPVATARYGVTRDGIRAARTPAQKRSFPES